MIEHGKAFLTVEEFANRTRLHPNTVTKLIKEGKLKAFSSCKARNYRIPHTEIDRLIEMQTADRLLAGWKEDENASLPNETETQTKEQK